MQNARQPKPLEIGPPPTDRPFLAKLEDKLGPDWRYDFGPCVVIDGVVCSEEYRKPLHSDITVVGWREIVRHD